MSQSAAFLDPRTGEPALYLEPQAIDSGLTESAWELDLWSGDAHFGGWLQDRLPGIAEPGKQTLFDLKPHLVQGAWEVLLRGIREHLERNVPLDTELCVQLDGGRIEWWRISGAAERNGVGQPVHIAGSFQDVSDLRR